MKGITFRQFVQDVEDEVIKGFAPENTEGSYTSALGYVSLSFWVLASIRLTERQAISIVNRAWDKTYGGAQS